MVITWYGEGCFKCQSGELTVLSDPFDSKTGLNPPRLKPTILLRTLTAIPMKNVEPAEDMALAVNTAGEYDSRGIDVSSFSVKKESSDSFLKTVHLVDFDDIRLCFLGHLSDMLDAAETEPLEEIDVLFIPAGGKPFISQEKADKLIRQLAPKVVIPAFFKIPGLKRQSDDLKEFMKELGQKVEPQDKFTFKKKDLSASGTKLVALKI
ncbi:MAG: MBL fold metallo-hydrolase [Parcubacteria group bacterium]|nr:MBL fold metallo-hydrolase [Parcubacteria group bacterium]